MRRTRTNVYLDDEHLKALRAMSEKSGAPVAVLIRRAVDAYLAVEGKKKSQK